MLIMSNNKRDLTKSKFKLVLECPTKLFYVDKPEYANQKTEDAFLKALAEGGAQVEALARSYHPDGILITENNAESAIAATQKHIDKDSVILFPPVSGKLSPLN